MAVEVSILAVRTSREAVLGGGAIVDGILFGTAIRSEHGVEAVAVQDGSRPVDHVGRLVDPHLHDAAVALAGGVAHELLENPERVLGEAGLDGLRVVDAADGVARRGRDAVLFDDAEVKPKLGGLHGSRHAGVAGTHDEQIAGPLVQDGGLVDLGRLAQPGGRAGSRHLTRACISCRIPLGAALLGGGGAAGKPRRAEGCGNRTKSDEASPREGRALGHILEFLHFVPLSNPEQATCAFPCQGRRRRPKAHP